ncbi:MAG: DsbA family protein [Anaerolineales bacterium]|nr:DsbA family protein [Anaerolineales bacterium]
MSKKEERRQRRAAEARRRQLLLIGGITIVAVAIVGWLVWQNVKPIGEIVSIPTQTYAQANGKTLGAADAPVTILLFSDFQCPICKVFADNVEQQVIATYVDTGRAKLEYHHFIVIDGNVGGSESRDAAEASECANDQGQFWNFHDLLYANQGAREGGGAFTIRRLKAMGAGMGLDSAAFDACIDSNQHAAEVRSDEALAAQYGVSGTPSVFINGNKVTNPNDLSQIDQLITLQEQQ